jgi:hypothetical protein
MKLSLAFIASATAGLVVGPIDYATWQKDTDQTSMAGIFGIVSRWQQWHGRKPAHCTNCACVFGNDYSRNFNHFSYSWQNQIDYSHIGGDHFAVSAETYIKVTATSAGTYRFFTSSDDGSMLLVNGKVVVNNDGLHGMVERNGAIHLSPGVHKVRSVMFEHGGGANFKISYQPPGGAKTIMDTNQLSKRTGKINSINFGQHNGFLWDHWAIRAQSTVKSTNTATYKFRTLSDDGSELYINNQRVVANGGLHGAIWREGSIRLNAGVSYNLEASMFEHG